MPGQPFPSTAYSEQLEKLIELNEKSKNVAVLWDIENVNPGVDSLFLDGFRDYIVQYGRITIAKAFADWSKSPVKKIGELLAKNHFELIHVPKAKKNSADITLITHGIEIALKNPGIDTFILVTGDADFRPLVLSLRKAGKHTHIVCDVNTSSEDLLILADSFVDYRELRPGGEELTNKDLLENITTHHSQTEVIDAAKITKEIKTEKELDDQLKNAFSLLAEGARIMIEGNKEPNVGNLRVRLLMLNPKFDEKKLGFTIWSNFIESAEKHEYIKLETKNGLTLVKPNTDKIKESPVITQAFDLLIKQLEELDKGDAKIFHEQGLVALRLRTQKNFPNLKKIGFTKFKDFAHAAEVRKLIETKVEGMVYYLKNI